VTEKRRWPSALFSSWRPLLGVVLLVVVLWRIGPDELVRALRALPASVAVPAAVLAIVPPICHAWRWRRLLALAAAPVPLREAVRVTVAASVANYLLPAFGWAPAKVLTARQWLGVGARQALPTLVIEQVLDLAVLAGLAIVGFAGVKVATGSLLLPASAQKPAVLVPVVLLASALVAMRSDRLRRFVAEAIAVGWGVVRVLWHDPVVWLATAGRWSAELTLLALLVYAARLPLDWRGLAFLLGVPGIVGVLSPIPGGLGVREATGVLLARWVGWSPVTIAAVLAGQRLATLAGLGVVGIAASLVRRTHP